MSDGGMAAHAREMDRRHAQERTPAGIATWMRNMPRADLVELHHAMSLLFGPNGTVPSGVAGMSQQAVATISRMIEERFA